MNVMPELKVSDITVRFGGVTAVDKVSLSARGATITGLIGPNGAGKTTTFNACVGSVRTAGGKVWIGDELLNGHSTSERASMGLGRTFQRMALFDSMTVVQNVSIGLEAFFFGRRRWGHVMARRGERREIQQRADLAMHRCGIVELADARAGALPTGQRRLVELARAMAPPFKVLLLDEPSSGLDVRETERFGGILEEFVTDTGVSVLLVEHDIDLVSAICTHTYVLDFGHVIFSGSTAEMLSSDVVKAAYLGDDAGDPVGQSGEIRERL